MKQGKIIVIEGTDCSGKETQSNKLLKRLNDDGVNAIKIGFPMYDTPTGKIVGGPYLGKDYICDGWFPETSADVDAKVSALYFAADRKYNADKILDYLNKGYIVLLDRYVESNMAHQGGKIANKKERHAMYKWLEKLEYELLELPKPDLTLFLYMPFKYSDELKKNRVEKPDQNEASKEHLMNAEQAYLELAELLKFKTINCVNNNTIRTKDDISDEIYEVISNFLIK